MHSAVYSLCCVCVIQAVNRAVRAACAALIKHQGLASEALAVAQVCVTAMNSWSRLCTALMLYEAVSHIMQYSGLRITLASVVLRKTHNAHWSTPLLHLYVWYSL
jgi:hypothetical protein